jgi:hypothetical protein
VRRKQKLKQYERGEIGMNGKRRLAGVALVAALGLMLGSAQNARAQTPAGGQDPGAGSKQPYTMAEYNAFTACQGETNPTAKVKCLDDFVSKYPNSALLIYIYPLYSQAYGQLKNYAKVMEYSQKLAALPAVTAADKFNAYYAYAAAYNALISDRTTGPGAIADATLNKGAAADATTALKTLDDVKKPDTVTDDAWATQKKTFQIFLNGIGAQASLNLKDYTSAIAFYKAVLALKPDEAITSYNLGKAYLALAPPQTMDAFWAIARAVTSKSATEAQSKQIKTYLRKLILNYQQAACDTLTDAELNELLQLASSSPDRPDSYKLISAAELSAAQKDMTIASVVTDLKAGGDKSKVTWLAACGLDFGAPGIPGKAIEVVPGTDAVVLKVAFVTNDAEFEAATIPNMDVKVVGQPDAARVEKDSAIHFTGTLVSYDPDPAFMLHWDKAKVNEEDIPKAKTPAKKPVHRPAAKPSGN